MSDQHCGADEDQSEKAEKQGAQVRYAKGMHRGDQSAARYKGAKDGQAEGKGDQGQVPHFQQPFALLYDDRMKKRGAGQPRHKRGILDRVPGPVAAPAQLHVRPLHAEEIADGEEQPAEEGPAANASDPFFIQPFVDQRSDGKSEWHCKADKADVQRRRMKDHLRILQQRIEPYAVGRRHRCFAEGVGFEQREIAEKQRRDRHDRQSCGDEIRIAFAVDEQHQGGEQGQQPGPQQQGTILTGPESGQGVGP
ncbi:MAG: hypothetical protein BWY83_00600 [bacterium ADurb.Bin478]|nr:MAG: hypothetical protein BWY83_00600 [bacterium ADurb.Bin478]